MDPDNVIAPSEGGKDKQTKPNEEKPAEWKTIAGDRFKTEAELAKAYKELETKFGQQSDDIRKGREFAETVAPVLEIIKNDPDAFKLIDEKLRNAQTPKEGKDKTAKEEKADKELRDTAQAILMKDFEGGHNFANLSKDEQASLRGKIGSLVQELTGQNVNEVDLRRLPSVLDKAYILATQSNKHTDQEEETEPEGAISSMPSSKGKTEARLTPEERTVASKLGLTAEQYLSGKK